MFDLSSVNLSLLSSPMGLAIIELNIQNDSFMFMTGVMAMTVPSESCGTPTQSVSQGCKLVACDGDSYVTQLILPT